MMDRALVVFKDPEIILVMLTVLVAIVRVNWRKGFCR